MHYQTKFVWAANKQLLYVFYNYKQIGMIPTGMQFGYQGREYSTILVMNVLASLKKYKGNKYSATDWYDLDTRVFQKRKFISMCRRLTKQH